MNRLSPMTSYYLRKFVEDRQDSLHELLPDLHGTITLDRLFSRMKRQQQHTNENISIIESLVDIHKQMAKTAAPESMALQNLDKRLFASLGIKEAMAQENNNTLSISIAKDCLEVLNNLRTQALFYLGDKIGTKYLLETRPTNQWCQQFQITPQKTVTFEGPLHENLKPEQVTEFETWIDNFVDRCGGILSKVIQDSNTESEALFDNI